MWFMLRRKIYLCSKTLFINYKQIIMRKEQKEALIWNLKSALDTQSRIAILLDAEWKIDKQEYSSEDLLNATQIFMHVLWNVSIWYWIRKGFTEEQMLILAEEMWESLKKTINLYTGIDIPSLVKRLYGN